ncbi:hypothetical protein LAV72_18330 [Lysinibacillus xylanilyticus]|uniref:hypothetical protein n=1 Tax=Lysinibacillus xylanilyticus TaxID=582475 RepID=UPI002B2545A2|nr:hypothetical protein [Lysinibacillus xylanilyticus]MEB2301564.1 hypothetical protein [Lysinibacillus xylanilyticus]
MLNAIGTALSSFQQYRIQQKSKGLGLLVFFLIILLLAKWNDWFQPLANMLGITTFAHDIGLIQSTSVMTFLVAFILFVILLAFLSVLLYLGAILQSMFITAPVPVRIMLLLPFLIIGVALVLLERIFGKIVTKKEIKSSDVEESKDISPYLTEQELTLYKKHEAKGVIYQYGATYLDQFTSRSLSNDEAARFLNKAFAHANSTSNILVGFSRTLQRWFIIGAQPLPRYASSSVNFSMTDLSVFGEALDRSFDAEDKLYVPAQGLYIEWDSKSNSFITFTEPQDADPRYRLSFRTCVQPIDDFEDIRMVMDGPFVFMLENSDKLALTTIMHKLHVLAYALPAYYPEEIEKYHLGERNYVTASAAVSNYSALKQVYIADVLTFLASHLRQHPDDYRAQNAYKQIQRTYS